MKSYNSTPYYCCSKRNMVLQGSFSNRRTIVNNAFLTKQKSSRYKQEHWLSFGVNPPSPPPDPFHISSSKNSSRITCSGNVSDTCPNVVAVLVDSDAVVFQQAKKGGHSLGQRPELDLKTARRAGTKRSEATSVGKLEFSWCFAVKSSNVVTIFHGGSK